jgi:hypothetical protein
MQIGERRCVDLNRSMQVHTNRAAVRARGNFGARGRSNIDLQQRQTE